MKNVLFSFTLIIATAFSLRAGDSAQQKAFVDKYRTAFEAKDTKTLESFLYTEGANPMALEFYKMMMTEEAGGKISKIELVDLSPEDAKKAEGVQEGPGGTKTKLPLKATKKLKISVETKDGDSTSSSTSENFIGEKGGKFYILVPADAK
jgi:hypothetical protein